MATSPQARLITFDEFQQIPNPPGGIYELYHGELVKVGYPKHPHVKVQYQLRELLRTAAIGKGIVDKEIPFRPLPEYECWGADIAFVSKFRWDAIEGNLMGAPDLVAEVLSPSNTAAEMLDRQQICLENGCRQFWVVDPKLKLVRVSTLDGPTVTYKSGQDIPLFFAAGERIEVDGIFV